MTARKSQSSYSRGKIAGIIVLSCCSAVSVGLLSLVFLPVSVSQTTDEAVQFDVLDAQQQLANPLAAADRFISGNPALAKEVLPAEMGTVQNLGDLSQPDFEGIDPNKSQAEQSLDDGSGLTYPCVSLPGDSDVCQRKLTEAEAKARGY